jgi:hypothetical protein
MSKRASFRLKNLLVALSVAALASTGMGYITTAQAEDHASGHSSGSHSSGSGGKGGSDHSSTESGHKDGGSGGGSKSLEGKVFQSGGATDEHGSSGKGKGKGPKYKGGKSGESSPDEGHSHDK